MTITREVLNLLEQLKAGNLDGIVAGPLIYKNTISWLAIEDGIPRRYERDLDEAFFSSEGNACITERVLAQEWKTEEERIAFLEDKRKLFREIGKKAYKDDDYPITLDKGVKMYRVPESEISWMSKKDAFRELYVHD